MMKGTETSKLLAALREATARLRMNATNSFARFTCSIFALSISIGFPAVSQKGIKRKVCECLFTVPATC
jgi:hypothetical protein